MEWSSSAHVLDQEPARSLTPMSAEQYSRVVHEFNCTTVPFPHERLIHELFEEQAQRSPQAVAVLGDFGVLTYTQLNASANQWARHLIAQGLRPGERVPVLMTRSLHMILAQLAILKAGGVYVPLDPNIPRERQAFTLIDCDARRVLTETSVGLPINDSCLQRLDCQELLEVMGRYSAENLNLSQTSTGPAYVMYTSGSTGTPKGVIVPHCGVTRLVINCGYAQIGPTDCLAHCSNPAFDASTFEIWAALLTGARVVVVPQTVLLDPAQLANTLERYRVTVLWLTVGLFTQYADALRDVFGRLRYLITGGDVVDPRVVERVLCNSPPQCLINAYGPTECTTFSTTYVIREVSDETRPLPIGRPISNTRVYILDENLRPVSVGVAGELYIGGPGVALGYLNRPELTRERFIPDPFGAEPGGRLYRTGDLGRWREDGNIEFLGRNDQQVKVRGFRIELGEIEARLLQHPSVAEAVAVAREDTPGHKRLVAYIKQDPTNALRVEDLHKYLQRTLPDYMVPSALVLMSRLPLTPNGKVDRKNLPPPGLDAYLLQPYEPPRGELEETLAQIWADVLRLERVGRHDNFFQLGGHSLLMVEMMECLRRAGLHVEPHSIYVCPTLADLATTLKRQVSSTYEPVPPAGIPSGLAAITPDMLPLTSLCSEHIRLIERSVPGGVANIQDIYPLAPLQEGILFHHLLDGRRGDTYVLPTLLEVPSRERLQQLVAALQCVIDRHDVLRTAVLWEQLPEPMQVVYRHATLPVETFALDPHRDSLEQLKERMSPGQQRLELRQAPLMKLQVAQDPSSTRWYALLQMHHLVCDHESLEIVIEEVKALLEGHVHTLPEPRAYRDHVAQALKYARAHDAEAFFRNRLGDLEEPTAPFGLCDVHGHAASVEDATRRLDPELSRRVHAQARRGRVSAATIFHAAWAVVLARTSASEDVVFGTLLLGRMHGRAGAQRILGLFINTLPLRVQLHEATAAELLNRTQRELIDLLRYEQASLAVAQRCSGVQGARPLFTTLLNYRHSVAGSETAQLRLSTGIETLASYEWTNYPITVSVDDFGEDFSITAQTDRRVDPRRVIGYLITAVQSLLGALERSSQVPASSLSILPEEERRQVIETFNHAPAISLQERLIHELFDEQVRRTPDAVAVSLGGQHLTYRELSRRANQMAHELIDRGIRPDQLVALCFERSLEMVVGVLGVLKAGGAYLPLDPNSPAERLAYMLEDAAPGVLLTHEHLRASIPETSVERVTLESIGRRLAQQPDVSPDHRVRGMTSSRLAYVIYTSGSTGRPKGVMVEHRQVVRLFSCTADQFEFSGRDVWTLFHSLAFDFSVWELWGPLIYGGRLVIVPHLTARSPRELHRALCAEGVTVLNQTPSAFAQLVEAQQHSDETHSLRVVVFGGEALELHKLRPWVKCNPLNRTRLVNMYGITETTVHVTFRLLTEEDLTESASLIGSPLPDLQTYLLDRDGEPVPIGVTGELYVGGAGVTRGYWGKPELTSQRFLPDRFNLIPGTRLYRSGDLARWRPDGTLEYLGRNDQQVKIRGFRIELGEIEARLLEDPHIKEAVVLCREDIAGERRLVAYVTVRHSVPVTLEHWRSSLASGLPDYMIPSALVVLEQLPLTSNGKLDRKALPAPELEAYSSRGFQPPQGEVEEILAQIWRELLHVERVGREDSFFELGGHSLLAMRLVGRARSLLSVELPVAALFEGPRLRQLADFVEELRAERLLQAVEDGSDGIEELLERVASMADSEARELMRDLTTERRS